MIFSSKVSYDQNDDTSVRNLKSKFRPYSVLVIGNWSVPIRKIVLFVCLKKWVHGSPYRRI
ncbi:hypothetical protein BDF21DRAFT_434122 [Thamnidium elegans]|nr:hypothetical protein BDF21DRAFT_434122 [Thamnidium elegans]